MPEVLETTPALYCIFTIFLLFFFFSFPFAECTGTQRVERQKTQDFRDLPRTMGAQVQKVTLAVVEEAIRGRLMTQEVTID